MIETLLQSELDTLQANALSLQVKCIYLGVGPNSKTLAWLDEAQLDRVGAFQYENVKGARSNALPDHVPDEVKAERYARFMQKAGEISAAKLAAKVGHRMDVIVDEVDSEGATCRTKADAPEIDGNLFIDEGFEGLAPGDLVTVTVEEAGEYDLWGRVV
jgi:ribosomal protein S12 methylthiotransferase